MSFINNARIYTLASAPRLSPLCYMCCRSNKTLLSPRHLAHDSLFAVVATSCLLTLLPACPRTHAGASRTRSVEARAAAGCKPP